MRKLVQQAGFLQRAGLPVTRRLTRLPRPSLTEWFCLAGGLFLTIHYAWLLDDAFIYFRYVDNLLFLGHGLVYNRGEYVEGFSSPLWLLLLCVLRATEVNYWIIVRLLAVASFTALWFLLVVLNRRLSPPGTHGMAGQCVANLPLCYLSFSYGPLCYFTSGLETPLVQVAAGVYALFVITPSSRILRLCLAMTPLLRPELAVPFVLCVLWSWFRLKKFPLGMFAASALLTGSWLCFRVYYYADLLPNTFYLKDTVDIPQGFAYLRDTMNTYYLHVWLAVFGVVPVIYALASRRRAGTIGAADSQPETSLHLADRIMMLIMAGTVTAYVIKIGGDPRHYRFLAFPFVLAVAATAGLFEQTLRLLPKVYLRWLSPGFALGLAGLSASFYPPQLSQHPFSLAEECVFVNKINDASGHRKRKDMSPPPWGKGDEIEIIERYREFLGKVPTGSYRGTAIGSWCFTNYKRFDYRVIHSLGLTDAILARTIMKADRPAHKQGLRPMSREIADVHRRRRHEPGRGMYRQAVMRNAAPPWIAANLPSIELIERKIYNHHQVRENLRLAFTFPERIRP